MFFTDRTDSLFNTTYHIYPTFPDLIYMYTPAESTLPLLQEGIVSGLIRSVDWTTTNMGSEAGWPLSLRFSLDNLLHSGVPQLLFWGPELNGFFNDAFLEKSGVDPEHIGQPATDCWPEAGTRILPFLQHTLHTGKTCHCALQLNTHPAKQENWNLDFSRILDETGMPAGVLVICSLAVMPVQPDDKVRDLETAYEFGVEALDLGTWELDPVTRKFRSNQKTREIFGIEKLEPTDLDTAIDVIHPMDKERVQSAIEAVFAPGSSGYYDIEYTIVTPGTKAEKIVRARGRTYFDKAKQPIRFAGTIEDITARVLSGRRKEKLQQLVENSSDYMSMATLDGRMTYMNLAGRIMLGLSHDAVIETLDISTFYSQEQFAFVKAVIIPALDRAGHWNGKVEVLHQQTGEAIPCEGNYILITDPVSGKVISRGLTLRDLRPEIIAGRELEDSEKRFRNLVQQAPVATAIYTGSEMTIQWANDAMIRLWGKDKTVIGKTLREALPELEGQPFHQLLDEVYKTGEMYQANEDRGDLMVDEKLQTYYFNFSYKPLRDTEGRIYGILNMAIDVSQQVKVAARLRESEQNFRSLILQAPVGICLLKGEDFFVEIANTQYLELIDRRLENFVGQPLWDVLPEVKEQGFDKLLKEVRQSGKPFFGNELAVNILRKNELETIYINFVYEPLFDEQGQVESILVIAIDISAQVEARKKIEFAEERARLAIESAHLGTYEVNLLTGEIFPSPRFNELFDADPGDNRQQAFVDHIHPDDLPVRQRAHELSKTTHQLEYEARVIRKDGGMHWIKAIGQVYLDESEKPYKIIGIVQDITPQKQADEERDKFLALSHYSRDFIGMCDMQMRTIYINRAGMEMLGMEGSISDLSLWDCFFEEDHAFLRDHFFPEVLRQGHQEIEIRFRHFQSGIPVWVIYSVFIIHDANGAPAAMATVSRDITERKNMEQELEKRVSERTNELLKLNDELQQFTYVSSHDLKEPLRKIRIFAGLALQETDPSSVKIISSLEKVMSSASRMSSLLTDLLNYSTLSNPERQYDIINLNEVLQHVMEDMELPLLEKGGRFSIGVLPEIEGIPFQISQLFFNLVNNAIKFHQPDLPPVVKVESEVLSDDEKATHLLLSAHKKYHKITVSDNGIGFRQDFAQKIFVVFQRLHDRQKFSGNGIGLSLCKKIVENHQGLIFASSSQGKGSVFTVILPEQLREN
jgi:PAS domain S-box-containing protein